MDITFIDHIVLIVKDLNETEKFYSVFLGTPTVKSEQFLGYKNGDVNTYFTLAKNGAEFEEKNKDTGGLNHIAFGVRSLDALKAYAVKLDEAGIKNSGVSFDTGGKKDYIWMNDPNGIRVEIYSRPLQ